ncbi:MAG: hypothetical protein GY952_18605 [Rhodobacteraceae bacterium]|nr:hypothetical protein [Paracoccaceae bacterium]
MPNQQTETRYGILIANSTYDKDSGFHSLQCPLNDADAVRDVLMDPKHGAFAHVEVLKDKPRGEILIGVKNILNMAQRDDLVFIYFSGHGKTDDEGKLYLAASNTEVDQLEATGVKSDDVRDLIRKARTSKKAVVLDCCHAGAFAGQWKGAEDQVRDRVSEFARGTGTYVLMAAGALDLAEEDAQGGLSVLTRWLVDGLGGNADTNRDGTITLNELSKYVQKQVVRFHKQKPTESGLDIQGDVAISHSGAEPDKELRAKIRAIVLEWSDKELIDAHITGHAARILQTGTNGQLSTQDLRHRKLLDRLVIDDLAPGPFTGEWFRITDAPPEPAQKSEPAPAQNREIGAKEQPYQPKPAPWQPSAPKVEKAAVASSHNRTRHPRSTQRSAFSGLVFCLIWIVIAGAMATGITAFFDANRISFLGYRSWGDGGRIYYDFESGLVAGLAMAAVTSFVVMALRRNKIGGFVRAIYYLGIAGSLGFAGFVILLTLT